MTAQPHRHRPRRLMLVAGLLIAVAFLFGPTAGVSQAQSSDQCAIEQFIGSDGSIDFTAYSACVAALNASNGTQGAGLARTGSDVGQYVGVGAGLVALGAAFVWTSRRNRSRVNA